MKIQSLKKWFLKLFINVDNEEKDMSMEMVVEVEDMAISKDNEIIVNVIPYKMGNKENWEELCYILSQSIPKTASEQLFEQKVIQVFEKLGWREYKGEIVIRESIRVGSANRVEPDIILKSEDGKRQIVVEVKKPSVNIDYPGFKDQLSSYMRLLKLNYGVLIGSKIQLYIDGEEIGANGLVLVAEFDYNPKNKNGVSFIELFNKKTFSSERIKEFADNKLNEISDKKVVEFLEKQFLNSDFEDELKELIIQKYSKDYDSEIVKGVLSELEISIRNKKVHKIISTPNKTSIKPSNVSANKVIDNNIVISKRQAIDILDKYIRENNIIGLPKVGAFSNITVANAWWFESRPELFERDFSIMFNDSRNRVLYIFVIPEDRFSPPTDYFFLREDTNRISIKISIDDTSSFRDVRSGTPKSVSFIKYLAHKVSYKLDYN